MAMAAPLVFLCSADPVAVFGAEAYSDGVAGRRANNGLSLAS